MGTLQHRHREKRATSSARGARPPLRDLIREQGVGPVNDLDELGGLWPAGDDPDRLLRFLTEERSARRAVAARRVSTRGSR